MLLVIFGFRNRSTKIGDGQFHCPTCGVQRRYTLRAVRRWFTLFWVPLVPGKVSARVVTCDVCASVFQESVLTLLAPATTLWAPPSGPAGRSQN